MRDHEKPSVRARVGCLLPPTGLMLIYNKGPPPRGTMGYTLTDLLSVQREDDRVRGAASVCLQICSAFLNFQLMVPPDDDLNIPPDVSPSSSLHRKCRPG